MTLVMNGLTKNAQKTLWFGSPGIAIGWLVVMLYYDGHPPYAILMTLWIVSSALLSIASVFAANTILEILYPVHSHQETTDEYDHCLFLKHLNVEYMIGPDQKIDAYQYQLVLKNSFNKPIYYEVTSLEVNGSSVTGNYDNKGGTIRAQSEQIFYTPNIPYQERKEPNIVSFTIVYGSPKKPKIRKWEKRMRVSVIEDKVAFTDLVDIDTAHHE